MKILLCMKFICLIHFTHKAARETGALQAAKNKLEKQVEELTWRLQLEKRIRVRVLFEEPQFLVNLTLISSGILAFYEIR